MVAPAVLTRVENMSRDQRNAHIIGPADELLAVHAVRQGAPDIYAAFWLYISHAERRELVKLSADKVAVCAVDLAEFCKRSVINAVIQIHTEQLLRHPVRGHQPHGDQIAQRADKIAVACDEGKAQSRDKRERKRIDVNNVAHRVERLDGRGLFPVVGELARRVLLDDRDAVAVGELHELFAPLKRQDMARGVMIARIDKDEAWLYVRKQLFEHLAVHTVRIDGNAQDLCARELHHTVHIGVHGLLHHNAVTRLDQQRHDKVKCLVRLRQNLNFAR